MRLYFVRHGESEANVLREFSNRGFKHPLTARGCEQAAALARRLADEGIGLIFSSPLQRAVQTAEILAGAWSIHYTTTEALREWDVGVYEGTSGPEGWVQHAAVQEAWFVRGDRDARTPGGESFRDMEARFVPFVRRLVAESATSDGVLLVGHGGLFHAMLPLVIAGVDHAFALHRPLTNTGYVIAEADAGVLRCRAWCSS